MPHDLEALTIARGSDFAPRYLTRHDEPWIETLLEELRSLEGASLADVEEGWSSRIVPQLLARGAERHAMERVWRLARRHTKASIDAVAKPAVLRQRVFETAVQTSISREEVLALVAREHDVSTGDIVRSLFADRLGARRLSLSSRSFEARQPEAYLPRKLRELSGAALTNVLICVDRELASGGEAIVSPAILRFSGRIDVPRLLFAAEALVARRAWRTS